MPSTDATTGDYGQRYADVYDKGRRLTPEALATWIAAISRWLPQPARGTQITVLDVGSGTGRFCGIFASHFGCRVIGVEPSDKMRQTAQAHCAAANISYRAGCAEHLPCEDASCDVAWLSMVVHHFTDLAQACRELHRVLRPGGLVLVRTSLPESLTTVRMYEFFPSALEHDRRRLPSLGKLVSTFASAGLRLITHLTVTQVTDQSLARHVQRVKLRAVSSVEYISDDEWTRGLRAMELAAARQDEQRPVTEDLDLLVFCRD